MATTALQPVLPAGRLADGPWEVVVDDRIDGWRWAGLRVGRPDPELQLPAAPLERVVVPLAGSFTVESGGRRWALEGRASVFDGPTDVLLLGSGGAATITGEGRVAVAEAPADVPRPDVHLPRSAVPVELRGAGASSRQVHNFGVPGVLDAQRLIVCEVITPAGGWSSYPPHKHDTAGSDESVLEEVYWFDAAVERGAAAPESADPFGLFAARSSRAGAVDAAAVVRPGDVVLVPEGWHGPAAAPPGYDLYYLNVMAGPGPERAWRITDDPAHAWIRGRWADEAVDARLPMERGAGR